MNIISPSQQQTKPIPTELLVKVQQRLNNLLEVDWEDAERGVYPTSLLLVETFHRNVSTTMFDIYWAIALRFPINKGRAIATRYNEQPS